MDGIDTKEEYRQTKNACCRSGRSWKKMISRLEQAEPEENANDARMMENISSVLDILRSGDFSVQEKKLGLKEHRGSDRVLQGPRPHRRGLLSGGIPGKPLIFREIFHSYALAVWLTQWGSCSLGEQGYSAIQILRYYYGDDMYINTAESIAGIPSSWPGYDLDTGATGSKVRQMQEQLNTIAGAYPALPRIDADGVYGPATKAAVRKFQSIFGLPATGIVDYPTWYKISEVYVGVSRIAELN